MKFTLHIWRQENARAKGHFETYDIDNISADCSFLEMLDQLNEKLINDHIAHPVCFDNDCREGICGMCGLYINGRPHGNDDGVTTCQLHMRHFNDGDEIWVEPWRAKAFPIIKDLVVQRYHWRGARRKQYLGTKTYCRPSNGCGCMHRLRCMRGGL